VIAEGKDANTAVSEACSGADLATVAPDTPLDQAAQLMRERSVRRLPVVANDRIVGIVTIGDLAMERDEQSALADISVADPNR
jgi:CBS domain-containing protein